MAVPIKLLQLAGWLRKREADENKQARAMSGSGVALEGDALLRYASIHARAAELELVLAEVDRLIDMPDVFRQGDSPGPIDLPSVVSLYASDGELAAATRVVDAVAASLARFLSVVILEPPAGLQEVIRRLEQRDHVVLELLVDMMASDLARASRTQGGEPE